MRALRNSSPSALFPWLARTTGAALALIGLAGLPLAPAAAHGRDFYGPRYSYGPPAYYGPPPAYYYRPAPPIYYRPPPPVYYRPPPVYYRPAPGFGFHR